MIYKPPSKFGSKFRSGSRVLPYKSSASRYFPSAFSTLPMTLLNRMRVYTCILFDSCRAIAMPSFAQCPAKELFPFRKMTSASQI